VGDVLKDLEAEADEVLRLEAEADKHRARIRELLTDARREGHGPAKLERTIHSVYVKDTISRWTKDVAVPRGQRAATT
jgi:uncharacterized protein with PhoU and TrkA domain